MICNNKVARCSNLFTYMLASDQYFRIVNNNFLDIINHFIVNNCEINFSKEKLKVDILMTVFL